jgi:hypothetical protein
MTTLTATWVHGNALTAQTPGKLDEIIHMGSGTLLFVKSGTQNWFHIPISTPVLINNVRAQLVRVFILYQTDPADGIISNVWVYDGETIIQEFNNLQWAGPHGSAIDNSNHLMLAAPHSVCFGIGISFQFEANTPIDGPGAIYRVFIPTAGADFNMTPSD